MSAPSTSALRQSAPPTLASPASRPSAVAVVSKSKAAEDDTISKPKRVKRQHVHNALVARAPSGLQTVIYLDPVPQELKVKIFEYRALTFNKNTASTRKWCGTHPIDYGAIKEKGRFEAFLDSLSADRRSRDAAHEAWFNVVPYHGYIGTGHWDDSHARVQGGFLRTELFTKVGRILHLHVHVDLNTMEVATEALLDLLEPCKDLRHVTIEVCPQWTRLYTPLGYPGHRARAMARKLDRYIGVVKPLVREALAGNTKLKTLEIVKAHA